MDDAQVNALIDAVAEHGTVGWQRILLALLDWPFLLFVFLVIFVFSFRQKIIGILERGDIQIGWGEGRHIKLRELSDGIDKELDPIREEIAQLREELENAKVLAGPASEVAERALDTELVHNATDRMMEGLRSHKYRWRSVERLAYLAGTTEGQALEMLRNNPNVVLSVGKSGRQIARAKDR